MAVIELAREAEGKELVDIIRLTAKEQGFSFSEARENSPYEAYRQCTEFDPAKGLAFDTCPSLSLIFGDLRPEGTYQRLQCRTEVSTMIRNPVELEGEYAKYRPYFDKFIEGINTKLVPQNPDQS